MRKTAHSNGFETFRANCGVTWALTPDAPPRTKGVSIFLVARLWPDADDAFTIANGARCVLVEHNLGVHVLPIVFMISDLPQSPLPH